MEITLSQYDFALYKIELRWYWAYVLSHDDIFEKLPGRVLRTLVKIATMRGYRCLSEFRNIVDVDIQRWRGCGKVCRSYLRAALAANTNRENAIDNMEYIQ